jgi:hypothetical protein
MKNSIHRVTKLFVILFVLFCFKSFSYEDYGEMDIFPFPFAKRSSSSSKAELGIDPTPVWITEASDETGSVISGEYDEQYHDRRASDANSSTYIKGLQVVYI